LIKNKLGMLLLASHDVCYIDTAAMRLGSSDDLAARSEQLKTERQNLPVHRARRSLLQQLSRLYGSTAIIIGETGSGKTTQIPQVSCCFCAVILLTLLL